MIRITDALTIEHATLRTVFKQVEIALPALERLAEVQAMARMVEALLHQHGESEEHLLYVTLDHSLAESKQLDRMSQEHDELNEWLAKACSAKDVTEARQYLREALSYSRHHFEHEERTVFPLIHQRLSDDSLRTLGEAWYRQQAQA